jgi:AcrR family transcriptional regulator
MTDRKRPYRKLRRAALEDRTRERITAAAVELHGTIGPARTSILALAARAGVRRSTVYRHFPDELSLFRACSQHWLAENPFPDLADWAAEEDPERRLRVALQALYEHYRRTERMMANILRDEAVVPAVRQTLSGYRDYLASAREVLAGDLDAGTEPLVRAAIGHALAFHTWRSLALEQGLTDPDAADLMGRCIGAAAR